MNVLRDDDDDDDEDEDLQRFLDNLAAFHL